MPFRTVLSAALLSSFLAGSAHAAAPIDKLAGKRLADKILLAKDSDRATMKETAKAQAIRRHGARRAALRADFVRQHDNSYSNELPATPIRDQKTSGRCWIFTALNVFERDAAVKSGKPVVLSRAYVNARNLQLTAYEALDAAKAGLGTKKLEEIDLGEGGNFSWATQLVDRYGVVPERVMRDFSDSKSSAGVLKLLETTVSNAQARLAHSSGNDAVKILRDARAEVDRVVARSFTGKAALPQTFLVDGQTFTPTSYAAHLGISGSDYVSLEDRAAKAEGWNKSGKVGTAHAVNTFNTKDIELMKQSVRNAIDQGKKVYVSAPVGGSTAPFMVTTTALPGLPAAKGVMSLGAYDYASLGLPDAVKGRYDVQARKLYPTNHAMTIVGYDLDATGKVLKWKVENSWGKTAADDGIQHMYDDFFTTLVGGVGVPRSALPAALARKLAINDPIASR